VNRLFAPMIGLLGALAPAAAYAQTNLDQGKSASQIFASACSECHKAAHGLARGKNSSALADFLREHYTTNSDQAAALAAYVLGGTGGTPIGAAQPGRAQKPKTQQASASTEEPKPQKPQAKPAGKPEDGKPANTKLRRPAREAAKPKDDDGPGRLPSIMGPELGQSQHPTTGRNARKPPKIPPLPPEPAAVAHAPEPAPAETPSHETSPGKAPSPAASTEVTPGEPGDDAPVPRDNIPD